MLLAVAAATAYTATGEFLKGATADRVKGDRRLPYYPPQYPVEPPAKSKKSKKGGSKGYDPCYGKGKGKGSGTSTFRIAVGGNATASLNAIRSPSRSIILRRGMRERLHALSAWKGKGWRHAVSTRKGWGHAVPARKRKLPAFDLRFRRFQRLHHSQPCGTDGGRFAKWQEPDGARPRLHELRGQRVRYLCALAAIVQPARFARRKRPGPPDRLER
jgi:hypothetical protein